MSKEYLAALWEHLPAEERAAIEKDVAPRGRRRPSREVPTEDAIAAQLRAFSPPAPEAAIVKEPWQMTQEEYRAFYLAHSEGARGDLRAGRGFQGIEKVRKFEVQQALSEGKPVPPEVLADYPDREDR